MDNRYKIIKTKCDICGRTFKKIVNNETNAYDPYIYKHNGKHVCTDCERKYRIINGYSGRGYGYKWSTEAHFTVMDRSSTPTYGVEIEVAGNIKNIDKIAKITERCSGYSECSIGYDTSVEGAQFELSYAPGTYYWYMHESNLKAVCKLLQKDEWTNEKSETAGMHIHIGNIPLTDLTLNWQRASKKDPIFWEILKVLGGRKYNQYCRPVFSRNHHDAISRSTRWRTVEFRMFKGTYSFTDIMFRIRFLRQLVDNTKCDKIDWKSFSDDVKTEFLKLVDESTVVTDEVKDLIKKIFAGEIDKSEMKTPEYVTYWEEKVEQEYYGDEEYDEENEEEEEDY
jgi:hypothetical protein